MILKNRKWFYAAGVLLLVLTCSLFFRKLGNTPKSVADSTHPPTISKQRRETMKRHEAALRKYRPADPAKKEFQYIARPLTDPPKDSEKIEYPEYRVGGSGTRGAIRDQERNLIFRATDESPAVAITISPNEKLIWVSGGDRKSYIINTKGEEVANLAIVPPGKDMLGFGKWDWIDNHRLLGDSGVQEYDEEGKLVTCCGGDNVSEIRLYIYDLRTDQMEETELPENLRGKVVRVGKVLKTGEFQLGHKGDEFGWYQVVDREDENR